MILGSFRTNQGSLHSIKSVRIANYSGLHFPAFRLNTERYSVSLCIQYKCGKMRTRITPSMDNFYAVLSKYKGIHILGLVQRAVFRKETFRVKSVSGLRIVTILFTKNI